MNSFRRLLTALRTATAAALLAASLAAAAQTPSPAPRKPVWEVVAVADPAPVAQNGTPELEVTIHEGGSVVITSDRAVTVQVFSILGQLITQKQMQAGTVRLQMNARGIYILKADNTTRRISL